MLYGYIKADHIYKHIAEDVETRFDNSNYEINRQFPKGKCEKVIGLMKNKLRGSIMKEFLGKT